MENENRFLYKNIIGDAKETIDAIQRFIEKNAPKSMEEKKDVSADSVNRIINSVSDKDTADDIQKIINNL